MKQVLSHHVISFGTNGILSFYIICVVWGTSHSTGRYSPYYLLQDREMVLSTQQVLRAKVTPEMRGNEQEAQIANLKSSLRKACKLDRKNKPKIAKGEQTV
jgi:hypothetical protein